MKEKNRIAVLISGMLIQFCAGIIYMWSVFREPVATHLSWDAGSAAFTSSIMLACFVIGIVGGGRAQDKLGPRRVTMAGSVLIGAGMLLTSLVSSGMPWLVYVTYGIVGGLGVGAVYTCTVSTIQKWFPDKRGFATGMIVAAFGLSLVAFAPLAKMMLDSLGVSMTFIIFGGAFLVICLLASFFITAPPEGYMPAGFVPKKAVSAKQFATSEVLKTKKFYLIAGSMFFLLPAYFILNPLLMSLGVERGLTESLAVLGVMITGIASATGRLVISWASDKIGRVPAILLLGGIMLAAVLLMIIAQGVLFLVCIAAISFAFGGSSGVYAALTADNFGTKNAGLNFGCVMVAFGLSALISPVISNALASSGNYTLSFVFSAASTVISIVLTALISKAKLKAE